MANNISLLDSADVAQIFKTTQTAGVHVGHTNVDSLPALTNAGSFAVQESGAALAALQLIDDPIGVLAATPPSKAVLLGGSDGTLLRALALTAAGRTIIDDGGASITVDGSVTLGAAVTVSGTVPVSGPLTDTQLRAAAVPISGALTDTQLRATAVPVSGPQTDAQARATPQPVSGTVTLGAAVTISGTVPVSGPATDTQLRATPLPVSGTVNLGSAVTVSGSVAVTGGLTDTQLRATPVPVLGPLTDAQLRAAAVPISGSVGISGSVPVTGPLTNTEIRATALPVSGNVGVTGSVAVTGPATDTQLRATPLPVSGTVSVGNAVAISGSVPVTGPVTDVQLRATALPVSGNVGVLGTVPVSGPLTDAQIRATPLPISGSFTNPGTFPVQENGAALTALQLIDDTIAAPAAVIGTTKLGLVGGSDGTNLRSLAVTAAGLLKVDDGGGSLTVDGTVAISGSVGVTGPLTDAQLRASAVPVSVAAGGMAVTNIGTFAVQESGAGLTALQLIDDVIAAPAAVLGSVKLAQVGGSDGTNLRALAVTATGFAKVDDGGGSLTVDGTVGITGSVAVTGPLTDTQIRATALPVSISGAGMPVTNVGSFAVQESGAALTALQLIDDVVAVTGTAAPTKASLVGGTDGTNLRAMAVTAAGFTKVDDGGGSLTIDGSVGITGSVAVTGPLTDTQLRATAVPVSGPLTDAQIRASALPVSIAATVAVSGPLTDAQLRAARVPVTPNPVTSVVPTQGTQTSGAYAAGNFVDGKLSLLNIVPLSGGSGIIHCVKVASKSPQTSAYWVVLFNADPTGTTFTNNIAGSIADADLPKIIGIAKCEVVFNLIAGSLHQASALGFPFKLASGTTAYAAVITVAAITQTSTSDMTLMVETLPD